MSALRVGGYARTRRAWTLAGLLRGRTSGVPIGTIVEVVGMGDDAVTVRWDYAPCSFVEWTCGVEDVSPVTTWAEIDVTGLAPMPEEKP